MSSQCMVPNWNLSRQRQVQVQTTDQVQEEEEEARRFPHVHNQIHQIPNNIPNFGSIPNYGMVELTWENGHPTTHGLGGYSGPTKPTWVRTNETLESIVHQATYHQTNPTTTSPAGASSGYHVQSEPPPSRKRRWSDSDMFTTSLDGARGMYGDHHSACASASATFCRDYANDTNTMACGSFASPPSLKAKTVDDDSDCVGASEHDNPKQNEDREVTTGSHSSRRTRVAAVHNLSERKRRDRINQKMRALQKLVPNANKTDKSSMLDEAISYLKQLQAQVHLMSSASPLGMQQQLQQQQQMQQQQYLQMSLMAARMGMNTDMFGMNNLSRGTPPCLPPFFHPAMAAATPTAFVPPLMVPPHIHARPNMERATASCSVPLPDPYRSFLAQSMNMDLYSKMATLWGQQINQATKNSSSKSNHQDEIHI